MGNGCFHKWDVLVPNDGPLLNWKFDMLLTLFLFFTNAIADDSADITVIVKGMVCSFCVQGIEKTFSSESSVQKVSVDLDESLVSIWLKESQELDDAKIDSLVKDSGYNVSEITRTESTTPIPVNSTTTGMADENLLTSEISSIDILTNPSQGQVYIDNKNIGRAPTQWAMPEGQVFMICIDWGNHPICRKVLRSDLEGGYTFEKVLAADSVEEK
jgi:mercuric ion binding protein